MSDLTHFPSAVPSGDGAAATATLVGAALALILFLAASGLPVEPVEGDWHGNVMVSTR